MKQDPRAMVMVKKINTWLADELERDNANYISAYSLLPVMEAVTEYEQHPARRKVYLQLKADIMKWMAKHAPKPTTKKKRKTR